MSNKPVSSDAKRSNKQPFLTDVKTLRQRARQHIDDGAVTEGYDGDTETAVKVLNTALATEIICVLRYKRHYFMARGIHSGPVAAEFLEHAGDEQEHADRIAERIVQLGGEPDFAPDGLSAATGTSRKFAGRRDQGGCRRGKDRHRQLSR
jgi:bacterioferritin